MIEPLSVHESRLFHILLEKAPDFNCIFCDLVFLSIVFYTIVKDQLYVVNVLLNVVVNIVVQFLFYCSEIHWFLDNFEVIVDSIFCRIHRLHKEVSPLGLLAHSQDSLRCFDPCLFGLYLLNFWHVHFIRVSELLSKFRVFGSKFLCISTRIDGNLARGIPTGPAEWYTWD